MVWRSVTSKRCIVTFGNDVATIGELIDESVPPHCEGWTWVTYWLPSSRLPSQLSSMPLNRISVAPGLIAATASSQSVLSSTKPGTATHDVVVLLGSP